MVKVVYRLPVKDNEGNILWYREFDTLEEYEEAVAREKAEIEKREKHEGKTLKERELSRELNEGTVRHIFLGKKLDENKFKVLCVDLPHGASREEVDYINDPSGVYRVVYLNVASSFRAVYEALGEYLEPDTPDKEAEYEEKLKEVTQAGQVKIRKLTEQLKQKESTLQSALQKVTKKEGEVKKLTESNEQLIDKVSQTEKKLETQKAKEKKRLRVLKKLLESMVTKTEDKEFKATVKGFIEELD